MDDRTANGGVISRWPTCPFVDRNDNRCTSRFSLGRIDQAFDVCFGSFRACPMYHRLTAEAAASYHHHPEAVADAASEAIKEPPDHTHLTTITAHGRALPLRPTGT